MLKTLLRLLDVFSAAAFIAVLLAFVRFEQFGARYVIMITMLLVCCILPSFFMRADRYLTARGLLVVGGFMVALGVGISVLGLAAVALIGFPCMLAMAASIGGRFIAYVGLGFAMAFLVLMAALFITGHLPSPGGSLAAWNQSPKNWIVAIVCSFLVSVVLITLIQSFRTFWRETYDDAENAHLRLETLVEYAPDAIVVIDADTGQMSAFNTRAEELLGISKGDSTLDMSIAHLSPARQPSGEKSEELWLKYLDMALAGQHPVFEWRQCKIRC